MPNSPFVLVPDVVTSGESQMGIDLQLLEAVTAGYIPGALRFYKFSPACVSLGRFQPLTDIDTLRCEEAGVDVVTRPTGGTAVFHDTPDITYAFACLLDDPIFGGSVLESCQAIHEVIRDALTWLDIPTVIAPNQGKPQSRDSRNPDCFNIASSAELLDMTGQKLVGSAQMRNHSALLQHGSIPMTNRTIAEFLSPQSTIKPTERTCIQSLAPHTTADEIIARIKNSFATACSCAFKESGVLISESAGAG